MAPPKPLDHPGNALVLVLLTNNVDKGEYLRVLSMCGKV